MSPPMCYVAVKPCGCWVAVVADDLRYAKTTQDKLASWRERGRRVERATVDEAFERVGRCPHED